MGEELEVWILFDLFNEFFIREPHTGLDDQGSQRHAEGFSRGFAGAPKP